MAQGLKGYGPWSVILVDWSIVRLSKEFICR